MQHASRIAVGPRRRGCPRAQAVSEFDISKRFNWEMMGAARIDLVGEYTPRWRAA